MKIRAIATMHRREMNHTEEKYARYLDERMHVGEIRWWAFECWKFRLADRTWYLPDFIIVANDLSVEAHEVKAYWKGGERSGWQEDARVKVKSCAEVFPIRFVAVTLMPDQSWEYEIFLADREQPQEKPIFERLVEIEDKFKAAKFDTDADRNMAWQFVREACGVSDGR